MSFEEISMDEYQRRFDLAEKGSGEYYFIKGNVPKNWSFYHRGNGEGMWLIIDAETKEVYDHEPSSGTFFAYFANHCITFADLALKGRNFDGDIARSIEFEHRGKNRP